MKDFPENCFGEAPGRKILILFPFSGNEIFQRKSMFVVNGENAASCFRRFSWTHLDSPGPAAGLQEPLSVNRTSSFFEGSNL